MNFILNTDKQLAEAEVNQLNNATKKLWKDGISEKLVGLRINFDNTLFAYPIVKGYEEYYTKEMLNKAVEKLPENWDEIID